MNLQTMTAPWRRWSFSLLELFAAMIVLAAMIASAIGAFGDYNWQIDFRRARIDFWMK